MRKLIAIGTMIVIALTLAGYGLANHLTEVERHVIPITVGDSTFNYTLTDTDQIPHETITVTQPPSTVTVTTSPPTTTPPPDPSQPAPIAGQGYNVVFQDDFATFNRQVWTDHIWFHGAPPFGSNAITASNGVLTIMAKRSENYARREITTLGTKSFKQGYFEARLRWTKGQGSWPGFWMLSKTHAQNPKWPQRACPGPECLAAELDMFEGQGREPNVFYGTLHRNSCNCYGVTNSQSPNNYQPQAIDLTTQFHTYAALWTPTTVTWYLDGRMLMTNPVYDSFNQEMFLILQMWDGGWTGGTNSTTPNELKTEVDWVKVWQK